MFNSVRRIFSGFPILFVILGDEGDSVQKKGIYLVGLRVYLCLFLAAVKITCSELESIHWRFYIPFLNLREEGGVEYWVTFFPSHHFSMQNDAAASHMRYRLGSEIH